MNLVWGMNCMSQDEPRLLNLNRCLKLSQALAVEVLEALGSRDAWHLYESLKATFAHSEGVRSIDWR